MKRRTFLALLLTLIGSITAHGLVWPVQNNDYLKGALPETFIQATASGEWRSGCFGCVRNQGRRFHEGIDIKAVKKDKKGEPIDVVGAALKGQVVHINKDASKSAYGRFVILEHREENPKIYTLYAHLRSIELGLVVGQRIAEGSKIGILGRSEGGTGIPKCRAHLHFEVGLRTSNNFQTWYNRQEFKTKNKHGIWNGMNLIGIDPLRIFDYAKEHGAFNSQDFFKQMPIALRVRVASSGIPDFIQRYPSLLSNKLKRKPISSWIIDFTWHGLPVRWTPVYDELKQTHGMELVEYDTRNLELMKKRKVLLKAKNGDIQIGKHLRTVIDKIFG